jgi:predicted dehydrogenase
MRHLLVGTGGRALNYLDPIARTFRENNELVAMCDISQVRMDYHNRRLQEEHGLSLVPTCKPEGFERMVEEQNPDSIIVTSKDATHHEFILRGVAAGCDVITEKPMTVDAAKCRAILEAVPASGQTVRVTFNYRFRDDVTKVKELLTGGVIGTVRSVNQEYLLNTSHGADYFRRWHSRMADSGGLLVHKSTHHFDLVNWWIDAIPEQVFGYGDLVFYGRENALARGDGKWTGYDRYTGNPEAGGDPFAKDLSKTAGGAKNTEELYLKAEAETGYIRDRNVFRDGIDIYDTMSVNVRYRNGVLLTYSLNAFSPREGQRVTFNGDRGRLEFFELKGPHIVPAQSSEKLVTEAPANLPESRIRVFPHFQPAYDVEMPAERSGGHGGSDNDLAEQIFSSNPREEKWGRNAGYEQGAASIMVGIAANLSIAENRPVNISDLVPLKSGAVRLSDLI